MLSFKANVDNMMQRVTMSTRILNIAQCYIYIKASGCIYYSNINSKSFHGISV